MARRPPFPPTASEVHLPCEMNFCTWCDREMKGAAGNLRGRRTVKHGICRKYLKAQLAQLMSLPAPGHTHLPDHAAHAA